MALSNADIKVLYTDETGFILDDSPAALLDFAKAIEAEVRKQDTALIRQLTDLVQAQHDYIMALPTDVVASLPAMPGFDGDWADTIKAAARARLEGKP